MAMIRTQMLPIESVGVPKKLPIRATVTVTTVRAVSPLRTLPVRRARAALAC
jgi:hypothetical protein